MAAKESWWLPTQRDLHRRCLNSQNNYIYQKKKTCNYKFSSNSGFKYKCAHKERQEFFFLLLHNLLLNLSLTNLQWISWLTIADKLLCWILGHVEQDKMALMVANCTDTWCSVLTLCLVDRKSQAISQASVRKIMIRNKKVIEGIYDTDNLKKIIISVKIIAILFFYHIRQAASNT